MKRSVLENFNWYADLLILAEEVYNDDYIQKIVKVIVKEFSLEFDHKDLFQKVFRLLTKDANEQETYWPARIAFCILEMSTSKIDDKLFSLYSDKEYWPASGGCDRYSWTKDWVENLKKKKNAEKMGMDFFKKNFTEIISHSFEL
jgi:hypothetical protein